MLAYVAFLREKRVRSDAESPVLTELIHDIYISALTHISLLL